MDEINEAIVVVEQEVIQIWGSRLRYDGINLNVENHPSHKDAWN